jgi:hypothetical protein
MGSQGRVCWVCTSRVHAGAERREARGGVFVRRKRCALWQHDRYGGCSQHQNRGLKWSCNALTCRLGRGGRAADGSRSGMPGACLR